MRALRVGIGLLLGLSGCTGVVGESVVYEHPADPASAGPGLELDGGAADPVMGEPATMARPDPGTTAGGGPGAGTTGGETTSSGGTVSGGEDTNDSGDTNNSGTTGDTNTGGTTGDDSTGGTTGDDSTGGTTGDDSTGGTTGDDSTGGTTGDGSTGGTTGDTNTGGTTGDGSTGGTTGDTNTGGTTGDGSTGGTTGDANTAGGNTGGSNDVPNTAHCAPVADWPADLVLWEDEVLRLTNEARASGADCGSEGDFGAAPPLSTDPALRCAARLHSQDMIDRDYFDHKNPDGDQPWDRMSDAGYSWRAAGENIAAGQRSPESVVQGWLESDGHCANLMSDGFEDIGVGVAMDGNTPFWTQVFGL